MEFNKLCRHRQLRVNMYKYNNVTLTALHSTYSNTRRPHD